MGLDMYLTKKHYIGAEYKHRNVTGKIDIKIGGEPVNIDFNKVSEISEKAGYWRKANAIHNWFVQNCQDGVDECQETYVTFEQLTELKDICQKILDNEDSLKLIEETLPPTNGFFFGGTEIDEYYYDDLESTVKLISSLDKNGDYYYQSSW